MFIIWGFGKTTMKRFGSLDEESCVRCSNLTERELVRVITWFTIFFIPIIPYRWEYYLVCPICQTAEQLNKEQCNLLRERLDEEKTIGKPIGNIFEHSFGGEEEKSNETERKATSYTGKSPTQIAYLKEMEAWRKENK